MNLIHTTGLESVKTRLAPKKKPARNGSNIFQDKFSKLNAKNILQLLAPPRDGFLMKFVFHGGTKEILVMQKELGHREMSARLGRGDMVFGGYFYIEKRQDTCTILVGDFSLIRINKNRMLEILGRLSNLFAKNGLESEIDKTTDEPQLRVDARLIQFQAFG